MPTVHYTATVRPDRSLELPPEVRELLMPGQVIGIDMEAIKTAGVRPNESALETLRILADMKKNMRETDGSQTDRMIREGRAGAMYDCEPTE
jgi:hypothetical protein